MTGLKPENFSASDANTVKVTLESAQVELPLMLATKHGMIVKNGATTEELRFHPIGTGPFMLKELVPGELKRTFQRNPDYWREGLPKSECLTVSAVQEPVARAAAILSGDADMLMIVDPTTVPTLQEKPEIQLVQAKGGTALTMGMFNDTPPFDNVKVRQAMKLVVDREAMVKTALLGFGIAGNDNPILPSSPDAYTTEIKARDVAKAKQLLAEAGHPDGLSVDLYVGEVYPGIMPMAQAYQQMAAEAGITVNLIVGPAGEFWDNVWMKYPFTVSTWGMRPTPLALSVAYRKAAKWNETHFYRDDFDALLDKAAVTLDADARRKVYQDAQRMIAEEGGTIIPMFSATVAALRPGCTGYTPSADHNRPRLAEVSCQ
jgi:peptide/nickel transport system substrate-binding protein